MASNIIITLILLVITTMVLARILNLPRNIQLLFMAQPLVMAASPVIVFIGGILSTRLINDPSLATLPVTVMILGVASASIPAALLAKRHGRKFATFTGFSVALLAALLAMTAALIASFHLLVFASLLIGVSLAFVQQLRFAAIESTPHTDEVPKVLSVLMLSGIFAAFLGPEIAIAAKDWLASPYGFAGSFLMLAGLIMLAMVLMSGFENPQTANTANDGVSRSLSIIVKQPVFIIAIAAAAIGFALMSYLMTATPLSMHQMMGHSLNDTKWVIQSHIAAMYIPSLFTALLVKKLGLKRLLLVGTCIYAIVVVIALSGQQVLHYWWALMLLGIGWNLLFLTGTLLLPLSYRASERHKVQALNDFILFGFQAFASLMAGWVLFKAGWHTVVLSSMPLVATLMIVTWYYYQKDQQLTRLAKLTAQP